jgi:hypothetical protein
MYFYLSLSMKNRFLTRKNINTYNLDGQNENNKVDLKARGREQCDGTGMLLME